MKEKNFMQRKRKLLKKLKKIEKVEKVQVNIQKESKKEPKKEVKKEVKKEITKDVSSLIQFGETPSNPTVSEVFSNIPQVNSAPTTPQDRKKSDDVFNTITNKDLLSFGTDPSIKIQNILNVFDQTPPVKTPVYNSGMNQNGFNNSQNGFTNSGMNRQNQQFQNISQNPYQQIPMNQRFQQQQQQRNPYVIVNNQMDKKF